jgi:hypothetical protein
MHFAPLAVSIPSFELQLAAAHIAGSFDLQGTEPLRASGAVSLETGSLRDLLANIGMNVPRLRDATALGALELTTRWRTGEGSVALTPLEIQIDQTMLTGRLSRSTGPAPVWSFKLHGDRIALDRYTNLEEAGNEPFELPLSRLKALRAEGVISFDEAQFAGAWLKDVRLRLELKDGKLHEP